MLRGDGPNIGVLLNGGPAGSTVEVQTEGEDQTHEPAVVMNTVQLLAAEAVKAGTSPPPLFLCSAVQVFYDRGRPVEARLYGRCADEKTVIVDGEAHYTFSEWTSDPAPRWAEDGGLLPEDAARPHLAARVKRAEPEGPLGIRRWWNLRQHASLAFQPWRDLADLVESKAEQPEPLQAVARLVLDRLKGAGEELAEYALSDAGTSSRDRLVRGLKRRLAELRRATGMNAEEPPAEEAGAEVTQRAVDWTAETFKVDGQDSAEELRRRADGAPWSPWRPEDGEDFAFVLRRLVRLVWRNEVKPEAERARARRPAVARTIVVDEWISATTGQLAIPGLESRELRDGRRRLVATIDAKAADLAAVHMGLQVLRTPAGNRLVKSLVITAHRQHEAGETDPRTVQYDGGWSGLAKVIQYANKNLADLKALAKFGQHVQWATRDGIRSGGGWWSWGEERGVRGRPGFVRFILNDCLMPGFAAGLAMDGGHSLQAREGRRLVPELPHEPPTGGVHQHHHGAIWTLHRLFLVQLVDRAEELAEAGVVVVSDAQWRELAKQAGLPAEALRRVLDSWTEGESETAPKLVDRDGAGFRLAAEVYQPEHEFLVAAGAARKVGRKNGRIRKRKG